MLAAKNELYMVTLKGIQDRLQWLKHLRKCPHACRKRMHESHDAWTLALRKMSGNCPEHPPPMEPGTWRPFAWLMLVIRVTALASTILASSLEALPA